MICKRLLNLKVREQGYCARHLNGDGVPVFCEKIIEQVKIPYSFAPAHMNRQRAAAVAALAVKYYEQGKIQTAAGHAPEYLRLSQAERERKEKEAVD